MRGRTFALFPCLHTRDHEMPTHRGGCSPAVSAGKPRITESMKNLPEYCFLGFIPCSRVFAPAANFPNLFPVPSAHLDLLPAFVQLLGAQRGLCGRHFALVLLQPLPHGSNQLSEFVQLLLAGRCIPFSASEKVSESQSSCFALQLPPRECSTVESPGARLFIIIIRCCLGTSARSASQNGVQAAACPSRLVAAAPALLAHVELPCQPAPPLHRAFWGAGLRGRQGSFPLPQALPSALLCSAPVGGTRQPPRLAPPLTTAAGSLHAAGQRQHAAWC